jgi:hypothetical protein
MRLKLSWAVLALGVGMSGCAFAQDTKSPAPTSADIQALTATIADLQKTVALQNVLLQQLANPPKPKHRKIVKVLLVIERVGTDVGSAASISSVLGWVRP